MLFNAATISLLAGLAAAAPASLLVRNAEEAHQVLTGKRDPNNFRFYVTEWTTKSCGPNATNCVEASKTAINLHHDCNGGGCDGAVTDWATGEGLCDKEFIVCGRHLVMSGKDTVAKTCMARNDLGESGVGYAYLYDYGKMDKVIGTCQVDTSQHYGRNCDAFGATGFRSIVYCSFN